MAKYRISRASGACSRMASVLKTLASPVRLCLVDTLRTGPRSVGRLADRVGLHVSTASRHLAVLHASGLVRREKLGQSVCYELRPLARQLLEKMDTFVGCLTGRPQGRE